MSRHPMTGRGRAAAALTKFTPSPLLERYLTADHRFWGSGPSESGVSPEGTVSPGLAQLPSSAQVTASAGPERLAIMHESPARSIAVAHALAGVLTHPAAASSPPTMAEPHVNG